MLIVLHGEDTFRSRQKLNELQETYLKKNKAGFNFEKLEGSQLSFKELKNALEAQSLFAQKRLIIVEGISENKLLKELFSSYDFTTTKGPSESPLVVVFYERESMAKDKEYKKILKQATKVQEFEKLSLREAINYFSRLFSAIDVKIIQEVLKRCQQDLRQGISDEAMWQAHNELKKLYYYKYDAKIREKDLDALQIGTLQAQIFPTIDAIFAGNQDKAFHDLLLHWKAGEHPQILFNMIEMQLRNIVLVKDAKEQGKVNARQLGLHPYVVKKTSVLVDKFSWDKLKNLYERVESLDLKNKTGALDTYLASELLTAAVVSSV